MPLLTEDEIKREIATGVSRMHNYNEDIREGLSDAAFAMADLINTDLTAKTSPTIIVSDVIAAIKIRVEGIGSIAKLFPEQIALAQKIVSGMVRGMVEGLITAVPTTDQAEDVEARAEVVRSLKVSHVQGDSAQPRGASIAGSEDRSGDESEEDDLAKVAANASVHAAGRRTDDDRPVVSDDESPVRDRISKRDVPPPVVVERKVAVKGAADDEEGFVEGADAEERREGTPPLAKDALLRVKEDDVPPPVVVERKDAVRVEEDVVLEVVPRLHDADVKLSGQVVVDPWAHLSDGCEHHY